MEAWVGPAIVAAVISGLVSLIVVQLNFRQERKIERLRREEKIRDFQIALRAEIRSELANLKRFDIAEVLSDLQQRYEAKEEFSVAVPRIPKHIVFETLVSELHILPESVIDPVVLYVRQRQAMESIVQDMRDSAFAELGREKRLAMLKDYLSMWEVWRDLAGEAEKALARGAIQ